MLMTHARDERPTSRRGRTGLPVALLALAIGAAACSSGGSAATSTTLDKAAAKTAISQAYGTLFNFADKTVSSKIAVIQNGAALESSLTAALASSLSGQATGSNVSSVTIDTPTVCKNNKLSSPCATVVYDLLGSGGSPIFSGQKGYAVYVGGHWLVAKVTICSLLQLFYDAVGPGGTPPGC